MVAQVRAAWAASWRGGDTLGRRGGSGRPVGSPAAQDEPRPGGGHGSGICLPKPLGLRSAPLPGPAPGSPACAQGDKTRFPASASPLPPTPRPHGPPLRPPASDQASLPPGGPSPALPAGRPLSRGPGAWISSPAPPHLSPSQAPAHPPATPGSPSVLLSCLLPFLPTPAEQASSPHPSPPPAALEFLVEPSPGRPCTLVAKAAGAWMDPPRGPSWPCVTCLGV